MSATKELQFDEIEAGMRRPAFNIELCYQEYLRKVALNEKEMHPTQKVETRQAFFGGFGLALMTMTEHVTELSEDAAVIIIKHMLDQVTEYFKQRMLDFNNG